MDADNTLNDNTVIIELTIGQFAGKFVKITIGWCQPQNFLSHRSRSLRYKKEIRSRPL